jgi:hypothetical protein
VTDWAGEQQEIRNPGTQETRKPGIGTFLISRVPNSETLVKMRDSDGEQRNLKC